MFAVAREAASVDPAVAALWSRGKRRHLSDMTTIAESFAEHGLIPTRLSVAWATELLYVLLGPENWYLIRRELGHDRTPLPRMAPRDTGPGPRGGSTRSMRHADRENTATETRTDQVLRLHRRAGST